jgi:hypothetical protein
MRFDRNRPIYAGGGCGPEARLWASICLNSSSGGTLAALHKSQVLVDRFRLDDQEGLRR